MNPSQAKARTGLRGSLPIAPLTALLIAVVSPPGFADDTAKLAALFAPATEHPGIVMIPPGDYALDGERPLPLSSNTTVYAYGARFHLPTKLGDKARLVLFSGENLNEFRWFGGHFSGHVFDPAQADHPWEPNANTRAILLTTTPGGHTENITFRDVGSDDLGGAAITVLGAEKKGSDREIETPARNVTVENCTLLRTGKFMWDYGYLWQVTVWPEDYTPAERAMAAKYFRNDLVRGPVRMEAGDDRVFFDNAKPLPISDPHDAMALTRGSHAVCFFGDALPANIVRGRQYFVIESTPKFSRIAERPDGLALHFAGSAGPQAKLIAELPQAFFSLYAPAGSGPGKGAMDLVGCENVIVRGCRFSALGDTMHIQKSRHVVFANNQITGSRMGAFFLAEFCKDAVITGNTIDGTNGSRVISVEKSCEDVTIVGNTFRNGGRGSWINQPRNFVLADNVFVDNTTKCEHDPRRGRRSFATGDYERYAELYFTTYEPGGQYGNVTIRGNVFTSGPDASYAITFAPGGSSLIVADNIFRGPIRTIAPPTGCQDVLIHDNLGAQVQQDTPQCPARTFRSDALGREVDYSAFIPDGAAPAGGWPLVLLLHGAGRNHRSIVDDERCCTELAKHKMVVVFPDGALGWWLDSPAEPASRYQSMLRELLVHVRQTLPVSSQPERTGICGWSMGGYGAMRFAETFPGDVGAVATIIGLLDFPNVALPKERNFPVSPLFGQAPADWARLNCINHIEPLRGKSLLILSATNAFDATMNHNFHQALDSAGIRHEFREAPGTHDFAAVQAALPAALDYLQEKLR